MPGPKMRIVFVSAVLLVAVSSVLFGLDWTSAPMQPMPETKNLVFVAPPPPRTVARLIGAIRFRE